MRMGRSIRVDEDRVRRLAGYLDEQQRWRQGNKVLHGYPPPLLWRDREVDMPAVLDLRRRTAEAAPKKLIVYVGTPYCLPTEPDRCGFCLFPSEVYRNRGQLDEYLGYLEIEGGMYRDFLVDTPVESVYFGGGTANLYLPDQYSRLLDIVRTVLPPASSEPPFAREVTLEGVPQLFTREKLAAMKDAGVTRISCGAQQISDEMIRASGRRQTSEQVFRTIEWCRELGLPCSIDLIFGWPRQTLETMLADLEAVIATGVGHLTHYELNVAGRSHFALELKDDLPSREENLEMYRAARDLLERAGYRQTTAYDWEKRDAAISTAYRFEESWHRPLRSTGPGNLSGIDMWGWGFAGVSCFPGSPAEPGWTVLNHTRVAAYFRDLEAGRFPVERGFHYDQRDLRLNVLFQMLHSMTVSLGEYRRIFGLDLSEHHDDIWAALERRGWVEVTDDQIRLVGDGVFHTPLIQSLLARTEDHMPA
jgi:oxygen-independent coproporphyrinogen-3 oxidase